MDINVDEFKTILSRIVEPIRQELEGGRERYRLVRNMLEGLMENDAPGGSGQIGQRKTGRCSKADLKASGGTRQIGLRETGKKRIEII